MRLASTAALATAFALLVPAGARGQFSQYTQPGTASTGETGTSRESLERALEAALWRWGPVRVDPWIGLRDLSWHSNPTAATEDQGPEGDLSAKAGAGLRAYLPTGPSVVWSAHALPEYAWFADDSSRRRLNGRYGAGVFAGFNRLSFQATATRAETLEILSVEVPEQATGRRDELAVQGELELGFSTSIFAGASTARVESLLNAEERESGPRFDRLDRDEDRARAGLRYRPRESWSLGVGMEWTETRLPGESGAPETGARDLSTTGEAPTVEVTYTGPKFSLATGVAFRTLEPEGDSEFPTTETTTYRAELGIDGNRLSPRLYARRGLSLAISEGYSHFETEVVGISTELRLGHRTGIRVFGETGSSDFTALDPEVPPREDDHLSYGVELGLRFGRGLNLTVGGHRSEFDSNIPGEDRTLTVFTTGIDFSFQLAEDVGWP